MGNAELKFISIDQIKIGDRFRIDYGDIDDLAAAIVEKGVLQPITLDRELNLLAGGRRTTAAKMAGLDTMPCLIRDVDDRTDALEIELMENIQRKEMNWQERVALTAAIDELYKEGDEQWSGRKTAQLINKSIGGVSRHLQLAEAIAVAPELAKCKTEDDAFKLLKKAQKQITVKKLRAEQDKRMHNIPMVRHAESHFRVGDAFKGLLESMDTYEAMGSRSNIALFEVDPPYGIDLNEAKRGDNIDKDYQEVDKDEYENWLKNLCTLLYVSGAEDCWVLFWFGPTWFTEVKAALTTAGFAVDDIPGIWNKGRGQTNAPDLYLGRAYEPFFIARKGRPVINQQGRSNVFNFSPVNPSDKWHPTQRPVELIEELLATFAMPGTVCCSPFLGSGTTIMAAYKQKMACFGWDLNQKCKDRFLLEVEEEFRTSEVEEATNAKHV